MTCPSARLKHPDYIRWTVQTMQFLIVVHSPFHILITLVISWQIWLTWYSGKMTVDYEPRQELVVRHTSLKLFWLQAIFKLLTSNFFFSISFPQVKEKETILPHKRVLLVQRWILHQSCGIVMFCRTSASKFLSIATITPLKERKVSGIEKKSFNKRNESARCCIRPTHEIL